MNEQVLLENESIWLYDRGKEMQNAKYKRQNCGVRRAHGSKYARRHTTILHSAFGL